MQSLQKEYFINLFEINEGVKECNERLRKIFYDGAEILKLESNRVETQRATPTFSIKKPTATVSSAHLGDDGLGVLSFSSEEAII